MKIRIQPDLEKANSIKSMIQGRKDFIKDFKGNLRIRRNGSLYYLKQFEDNYLVNNGDKLESMIKKIEDFLNKQTGVKK